MSKKTKVVQIDQEGRLHEFNSRSVIAKVPADWMDGRNF